MAKNLRYKFGKKVRLERYKKDWSQETLADKAEVSGKLIGSIERFEVSTTIDTIEKLAKAFNLHPKELFDFSDVL